MKLSFAIFALLGVATAFASAAYCWDEWTTGQDAWNGNLCVNNHTLLGYFYQNPSNQGPFYGNSYGRLVMNTPSYCPQQGATYKVQVMSYVGPPTDTQLWTHLHCYKKMYSGSGWYWNEVAYAWLYCDGSNPSNPCQYATQTNRCTHTGDGWTTALCPRTCINGAGVPPYQLGVPQVNLGITCMGGKAKK